MPHTVEPSSSSTSAGTAFKKPQRTSSSSSLSQTRLLGPTSSTPDGGAKFPRIDECAHFHYETVDCGRVELVLLDEATDGPRLNGTLDFERDKQIFLINVKCKGKEWVIRRIAEQFKTLDELLHECVYDRKFTHLRPLNDVVRIEDEMFLHEILKKYISRLSDLPEDQMSCAPVLHWFDMDNKGTKLVAALRETADINIPAVAAAHTVRRYTAQSSDELSLEVGDMVSIIDMTDPDWWRGKCRLQVGSFPAQCVKRISDAKQADEVPAAVNLPSSPTSSSPPNLNTSRTKPIVKKHGKFMEFLRSFLITRPSKSRLKQTGILKERVFGCDLGEYLHNSGDEVPVVVRDCTEFVEKFGIVDGVYRISGVASHVQNLRHEYDCERRPDLNRDPSGRGEQSFCDPHSVAGLCKLYFRELPNPLLTYQLYNRFAKAINASEDERLLKIHDVIQQLPPPHYRTLKHLALHLQVMSRHDDKTSMHCRNLAIVWAPNLLRSRDLEAGLAAFTEARVQSVVTEFLIANADILFSDQLQNIQLKRGQKPPRPKSLMVLSGPKLISLEEAQARSKAGGGFSKTSGESLTASITRHNDASSDFRRSRKMSSPAGYPRVEAKATSPSKAVAVIPLSAGSHSVLNKQRQLMDQKLAIQHQQHSFPSNPQHYSSQHSTGWRSKLGSFLRKGAATPVWESTSTDESEKAALRRSQSDDSLLSSHSTRQDDDDQANVKSLDATASSNPPTLRHGGSPRSPRPKGRIFLADDQFESPNKTVTKHVDKDPVVFELGSTPDGVPTPSLETNPSSHNPFSGLDSDFPGVMGESGLGFNPLQYSPTFSSDSGIPELPKSSTPAEPTEDFIPEQSTNNDTYEGISKVNGETLQDSIPRKSIGSLDDIRIPKQKDNIPSSDEGNKTPSELDTTYVNSKIEDSLNENVKNGELAMTASVENFESGETDTEKTDQDKSEKLHLVVDIISSSSSGNPVNINSNQRKEFAERRSEDTDECSSKFRRSYYWKTEEIDHVTEIEELPLDQESDENRVMKSVCNEKKVNKQGSHPVDLPRNGGYSVQYACRQHQLNGRMHQSITATFVQDRPLESKLRRPHSIRRSMDVPPTDLANTSGTTRLYGGHTKQYKSVHDITRRHKAYAAWVSQHRKETDGDRPIRSHCRSLSTGDELDIDEPPIPAPRRMTAKPTPAPRLSLRGGSENLRRMKRRENVPASNRAISAPSTPVDGKQLKSFLTNTNPTIEQYSECMPVQTKDFIWNSSNISNKEQTHIKPINHGSPKPLLKTKSAPGIVSPSDNVCASTVLSWV